MGTQNKRIDFIDVAKGVGIILVVLGHLNSAEQSVRNFIYSFHMPFFFIISGMFFSNKTDFKTFLIKSVKALLIPYLVFIAIDLLVYTAMHSFTAESISFAFESRLLSATGLRLRITNLPIWFLFSLFIIRLEYYFVSKNKYLEITFAVLGILLVVLAPYFWYPPKCMYIVALPCFGFYSIGYRLKNYIIKLNDIKFNAINFIVVFCLIAGIYFISNKNYCVNMYSYKYGNPLLFYLNALLGSGVIFIVCAWLNRIKVLSVPLCYYGKNSIIIMVWHYFIARIILPNVMGVLGIGEYLYTAITQIIALLIIFLIMTPIIKISNKYLGFIYGK